MKPKDIIKIISYIKTPYGLLILSIIILVMGRVVFKKKYLNCIDIIKQHMVCFENSRDHLSKISIFLYFGVPMLLSLSISEIRDLDNDVINILTVIISILTSMFFTLLTLILDMRKRVKENPLYNANDANLSRKILKETYYSIMFEILISIIILILCFVGLFAKQYYKIYGIVLYYLVFVLLTNLFMVLKRIYKVIDIDIKND